MHRKRNMIIFPTGQAASQDITYFDVFDDYMGTNNIDTSIVLYPKTRLKIIDNATKLTKHSSLIPVPVSDAYSGTEDYAPAISTVLQTVLRLIPGRMHVVMSGGTAKVGNLAVLIGNLAEKIGIDVRYIWAAKGKGSAYSVHVSPRVIHKRASEFSVSIDESGNICVSYPFN